MGHGRIISGPPSARLSAAAPSALARLHWGAAPRAGMDWLPVRAPARSHHGTDQAPGSKASATCFQTRLLVSCCHTCSICAFTAESLPSALQAASPSAVAQDPSSQPPRCLHAPCSAVREDAQRPEIQDVSPPLRILRWAGSPKVTQGSGVCSPGGWRRGLML